MVVPRARADGSFCSTKLARLVCAFAVRFYSPFQLSLSFTLSQAESLFYWYIQQKKRNKKKRSELYETLEGTRIKYIEDEDCTET